jgi:hypothetical protein
VPRRKARGRAANRGREIPAIPTRRDIEAQAQALREANSVDPPTDNRITKSDNQIKECPDER